MKTIDTDVVVIAAGPSGLAAAAQASENGAKVVVFEKANTVGGAANMGMGPLGIGTKQQKDMMVDMDLEKAFTMFMDYTHWRVDANLVKKYFENSADTIQWLEDMGVEFAGAYKYFPKSEATWHIVAVNGGIGRNGGAIMNKAMMDLAVENGAEFHLETPVQKIIMKDGKAAGVIAKGADGEEIQCNAKAVIVCTGGAGDNPQMINELTGYTFQKDMFNFAIPGLKGDGIKMAQEAGAASTEVTFEMIYILPESDFGPESIPAVFMQPDLMVNIQGRRFLNEEQKQNNTFCGNAIATQKDKVGIAILDSTILKGYIKNGVDVVNFVHHAHDVSDFDSVVEDGIKNGNKDYVKADTLEELAEKLGVEDVETFLETVEDYNDMCDSTDTLFYKNKKFMKPVVKAPFYAAKFRCGAYGTLGGIKINENAEVLDPAWNKIPGLYAAGTDTCTIFGDSYMFLLPGNTMGYCLNTGRFAGEGAADYAQDN